MMLHSHSFFHISPPPTHYLFSSYHFFLLQFFPALIPPHFLLFLSFSILFFFFLFPIVLLLSMFLSFSYCSLLPFLYHPPLPSPIFLCIPIDDEVHIWNKFSWIAIFEYHLDSSWYAYADSFVGEVKCSSECVHVSNNDCTYWYDNEKIYIYIYIYIYMQAYLLIMINMW